MAKYQITETLSADVPIRAKDAEGREVDSVGCRLFKAGQVIDGKEVLRGCLESMLRLGRAAPVAEAGLKEIKADKSADRAAKK